VPRYPLDDEEGSTSEGEKLEDEDVEALGEEEAQDTEAEDPVNRLAQTEKNSKVPRGEPPVRTDATAVTVEELELVSRR